MMDSVARVLRSSLGGGRSFSGVSAPLIVLQDDGYDTVGGDVVFRHLVDRLCHSAVIVCLENPPEVYMESNTVIDCFTNPCGLDNVTDKKGYREHAWLMEDTSTLEKLEEEIYMGIESSDRGSVVVGVDGVSSLVQHVGSRPVAHMLSRVRRHPKVECLVIYLHADMHGPEDLALVSHDALCLVRLVPGWGLAVDQSRPGDSIGKCILCIKRSHGCKRTETYEYWMDEEKGVRIEFVKERHQVSSLTAESASVMKQMQSNMKLELSEEEKKAKTSVVLPYEHQGHHDAYHTNDYRDYLPAEAGGYGPSGHLGRILYVRESDSEDDFDSDEDPDDDLDI